MSCDAVLCVLQGFIYMLIFTLEPLDNAESSSPAERRGELGDRHRFLWQQGWADVQVQHRALQSVLTCTLPHQAAGLGLLRSPVLEDICKRASGGSSQGAALL